MRASGRSDDRLSAAAPAGARASSLSARGRARTDDRGKCSPAERRRLSPLQAFRGEPLPRAGTPPGALRSCVEVKLMPRPSIPIAALDRASFAGATGRLAEILHACVHEGASVGFVLPFDIGEAHAYWRAGVARALMADIEGQAHAVGRWLLTLDTAGDAAEALYRSLGYEFAGAIPSYARDAFEDRYDATRLMYKDLRRG